MGEGGSDRSSSSSSDGTGGDSAGAALAAYWRANGWVTDVRSPHLLLLAQAHIALSLSLSGALAEQLADPSLHEGKRNVVVYAWEGSVRRAKAERRLPLPAPQAQHAKQQEQQQRHMQKQRGGSGSSSEPDALLASLEGAHTVHPAAMLAVHRQLAAVLCSIGVDGAATERCVKFGDFSLEVGDVSIKSLGGVAVALLLDPPQAYVTPLGGLGGPSSLAGGAGGGSSGGGTLVGGRGGPSSAVPAGGAGGSSSSGGASSSGRGGGGSGNGASGGAAPNSAGGSDGGGGGDRAGGGSAPALGGPALWRTAVLQRLGWLVLRVHWHEWAAASKRGQQGQGALLRRLLEDAGLPHSEP
ncbi:hypothetical protein FOA52_011211 [Chlamydomonas sp. UWO 241]|nr:hypothetical protein FOA52_011211 [Chlamydomonas sp. UWO 241]